MSVDPLLGRQLANYRLEHVIGRGGMAQVYYGWDVKLERPVALKVIDARYRDDPVYAQRFVQEARAVAGWRHENIVQIYYADDQDGLYFFAMEYIGGLNLEQLLAHCSSKGTLLPLADVLHIGRAVARALDFAHQRGVIHRDVKPSNVMIAPDGRIVLTDFGLALDASIGSSGQVFGSPHYIAPEQARRSDDAVPQSDLYALGVMLYRMLTGTVPFDDPSAATVALQHLTMPPPSPRRHNPDLNAQTERVLLKALHKLPRERYPTGKALIDALEAALLGANRPASDALATPPLSIGEQIAQIGYPHFDGETASTEDTLIGQQIDEYRIDRLLGRGGMARVYAGVDVRLDRRVSIKVIDTPFVGNESYVTRFEREAQAIARLEHGHIVRLYRFGRARGHSYMAMQYIEGMSLRDVLKRYRQRQGFLSHGDAARIVRQIGAALDYAHARGVIHRDVKPSNILIDASGDAFLTDFGLALLTEVGTWGEILGSPHYVAPEQAISSARVVPQSDLYALGVIAYEMFAGQRPFGADDRLDVVMLHLSEPPPSPRAFRPEISPALAGVLLKALEKEPPDRYQSGAAFAGALDYALGLDPDASTAPFHLPEPERDATPRLKASDTWVESPLAEIMSDLSPAPPDRPAEVEPTPALDLTPPELTPLPSPAPPENRSGCAFWRRWTGR